MTAWAARAARGPHPASGCGIPATIWPAWLKVLRLRSADLPHDVSARPGPSTATAWQWRHRTASGVSRKARRNGARDGSSPPLGRRPPPAGPRGNGRRNPAPTPGCARSSGGCVAKRLKNEPAKASPKNMWLISSAWPSRIREPSARPPIFFSAPAIPPGLRVNWTDEASARNSRCRLTAPLISLAQKHAQIAENDQRQAEEEDGQRRLRPARSSSRRRR